MRVIIRYRKVGMTRFLSPLDTVKAIERNVRRAKIPVLFSRGFHPLPKMSYLDAITTGVMNLALYIQMEVEWWKDELFEILKKTALTGLEPVEFYITNLDLNEIATGYVFKLILQKSDLKGFPGPDLEVVKGKKRRVFKLGELVKDLTVKGLKDFVIVEYTLKRENLFSPWSLVRSVSIGKGLHIPILMETLHGNETLSSFLLGGMSPWRSS